ncbi:MAG: hypothetical protein K8U57_16335 [Planctomycetes bacterium]|nr:hypothetical protein [Planctomycetota bacterium]
MISRALAAFALSALLAATMSSQAQDPKEPTKPRFEWPLKIGEKDLNTWLKDLRDPDPAIREAALKTIPGFGPDVTKKQASKAILARMKLPSEGGEPDPGVRISLYDTAALIGFDEPKDETEAIRLLAETVDKSVSGSHGRLHAVQTIASLGPKAEPYINLLTGRAIEDASYETRRNIARCLGQVALNPTKGPNPKALNALAGTLAKDISVAVRMEALQALVMLGPPWAGPAPAGGKGPPPINQKAADFVAEAMRTRVHKGMAKGAELDKQLEIWCRVVLMRFDPKEINDENFTAIARHCAAPDAGPKIQALQALNIFGEQAGSKVDAVVGVLEDDDAQVLSVAIATLASMGVKGQGAIEKLTELEKKWEMRRQEQLTKNLKDKKYAEAYDKLEQKEKDQVIAAMPQEQIRSSLANAIKWIKASKPGMPGGEMAKPPEPEKK